MNKTLKLLLTLLCVVFLCIFLISGYQLISILREYKTAEDTYNKTSAQYVSEKKDTEDTEKGDETPGEPEPEHSPIEVDFEAMLAANPDTRGWLFSPGTVINYPLAQADDNFYYLDRMIDGRYNPSGTLFLDCLCDPNFGSNNTLIYGHNMNDGSMLHSIREYWKQEYYDEHPIMYLNTPTQNYKVEIFSGYITDAESDTYTISFYEMETYQAFLDRIIMQSDFTTDVSVTPEDRIITLSTCTYEYDNARYVLHGKLVPIE